MDPDYPPAQGKGAIDTAAINRNEDAERRQRTAVAAFFRAEARGFVPGHELDDWLTAERELDVASASASVSAEPMPDPMPVVSSESPAAQASPMSGARETPETPDLPATTASSPAKATSAKKPMTAKRSPRSRKGKPGVEAELGGMG